MFTFLPSRDPHTIPVEIEGNATKEDAQRLDQYVKNEFGDDAPFNILAVIKEIDGTTLKGFTEGVKFDAKRWKQFRKFAIISDENWIKTSVKIGDYLPGVTTEHFASSQLEEAWSWMMQR
ncbi:SpoIIAA family protein [Oceanobacillus damuensis]|uniref:STAS/SEC14 domain-containing protein n=1 Tax=Oceanobacillus damuensis TaxID=937928 RepID=UPI0008351414|nr:STAS/SEC14 domain-containing protein [Oceanobacillus damuensis]